jgi:hypothetical protein
VLGAIGRRGFPRFTRGWRSSSRPSAQLPPWFVVGFGAGIAAWFALDERSQWAAFLCIATGITLGFGLERGRAGRALGWFALAATLGCALVWARSEWITAPRLERPLVTNLTGRVLSVDHLAAKERVRLMLATQGSGLPPRVRVSVDEEKVPDGVAPGAAIRLRAVWSRRRRWRSPEPTISRATPGSSRSARSARQWVPSPSFKRHGRMGSIVFGQS